MTREDYTAIRQSLCAESFVDFIRYARPGYVFNWHHLVLIDALQRLAERKIKRLVVQMPPRHGKSELVSRLFPAWVLGCNPDEQVILASYSADLAHAMNRDCQRLMTSAVYPELFPQSSLGEGREVGQVRTAKRFDIIGHRGYYVSAGVGGGITGVGCTVGIIDDPVKNAEEADSPTYRNNAWEWYTSTFKTRFEPGAVEVICQTRWHEDDLTGRVLKAAEGEGVEVINLPAIAERDEPNRKQGEALWTSKYDLDALAAIRKDVGTRTWNALYQQRPAPEEGGVFKKQWFQRYKRSTIDFEATPVFFYVDTAYTDQEKNDPAGLLAYVKRGADFYILKAEEKWLDFPAQLEYIPRFCAANGYTRRSIVRVEPKATGKSLVQVLKAQTSLNIKEADAPKESKLARANSAAPVVEAGRVHLPEGEPWVDNFVNHVAAFPNAAHDDMLDCLTGMILNERPAGLLASG